MILLASMALAACGGGNNSEANRTEDMDGTEQQSVSPESGTQYDTTNTMSTDTTGTMGTGTTDGTGTTGGTGTGTGSGTTR